MNENNRTWAETWYAIHDKYDCYLRRLRNKLPKRDHVQKSWAFRWFGSTLLRRELWSFKSDSVANGLALGLFVAFTPTMGFQMFLACVLILFFPGNLPIAIVACWITNPLTAIPIYIAERNIGRWLMEFAGSPVISTIEKAPELNDFYNVGSELIIGSIFVGAVAALLGFALVHGFVFVERRVRFGKYKHLRRKRTGNGDEN